MHTQTALNFDGKTFSQVLDGVRLTGQLLAVYSSLSCGQWLTFKEIQAMNAARDQRHDSEAGISARIRDLRKEKFGSHIIERRRRGSATSGIWEYRLGDHYENN